MAVLAPGYLLRLWQDRTTTAHKHTSTHTHAHAHSLSLFPQSCYSFNIPVLQLFFFFLSLIHLHTIFLINCLLFDIVVRTCPPRFPELSMAKVLALSDWMSPSATTRGRHLLQYSQVVLGHFHFSLFDLIFISFIVCISIIWLTLHWLMGDHCKIHPLVLSCLVLYWSSFY